MQVPSANHRYEIDVVPPLECEVRVIDWPASMTGDDGVICPATRVGLTLTVSAGEHAEAGVLEESVTLYE